MYSYEDRIRATAWCANNFETLDPTPEIGNKPKSQTRHLMHPGLVHPVGAYMFESKHLPMATAALTNHGYRLFSLP